MALQQAGDLRKQLDARKKEAGGNTELLMALQGLEKKVEAAVEPESEGVFMLSGLPAPDNERKPLPRIAAALTSLLTIVDGADVGPAGDAVTASARWEETAQETLARWATFQKDDLASVNALLEKAKLKTLVISSMIPGDAPAAH
jgi:hypothetical protein